ncbi:probable deca-heme c-type cytochrome [hydrothermal vent metagenome]|uniref:Probable deca-heme c-type cytochrome n=1 Tax=hydrothermal vent metagenome TaxID=652676 RepID=A0A1W1BRZ1_9ZZZZ
MSALSVMKKRIVLVLMLSTLLSADNNATYIGDKSCIECHAKEVRDWQRSDHDLAMKEANAKTVLGDFNDSIFELHGIKSSFYKKGGRFFIRTDGEDGKLHDYEVVYTFGHYPLQQYLIKFPDGKYQIPDIAWDSRSKEEGGQRWYHIHQEDTILAGDPLHWTGINFNWNFMCADCHSTNLKKNYDPKSKSYHTTWDVINVSCEACHGPASKHLEWTKSKEKNISNSGFAISLLGKGGEWQINNNSSKPELFGGNLSKRRSEVELCAKCHSRRSQLDDDFKSGDKFRDHYLPSMLNEGLYFSDGKINDEVYVYDSFKQSKMYAKGVTCTDCHDSHTLKRKNEGDKVCYRCHMMSRYKTETHHHHKAGSAGSSCIGCHMPSRTYMGVDNRNDHSFRIPRPDLSVKIKGLPNACNNCHKDKNASWATEAMKSWYGKMPVGHQNFAHALQSLRSNSADAPKSLYSILMSDAPNIAKATATGYLGNYPSKQTYTTTLQMLRNNDGDIRFEALQALESFPPKMKVRELFRLLDDPLKTIRTEAARQLSSFSLGQIDDANKALYERSLNEYIDTLNFNADRPESQLALASLYRHQNQPEKAIEAYQEALRLAPIFAPAYINYSDFLRGRSEERKAYEILRDGIKKIPDIAVLHYSLGLWYVRNKENDKGVEELKKAVELDSDDPRLSYVYAVAIGEQNPRKAIEILEKSYQKHTGDLQIVSGLAYYYSKVGDTAKAEAYRSKATALQNFSVR